MADNETVITHLQIIHTWAEFARERDLQFFTEKHLEDIAQWTDDALNLLKGQYAETHGEDSGMCEICSFYERAMPVKPHYNARTNWYECGACHYSMTSGMHCRSVLIPAYKVGYCAKCGKAVTWE